MTMQAPFPYFGGKSEIASVIWDGLGDVRFYLEPFCGSGAVLLARPQHHRNDNEIINDFDCHIANVWRGIKYYPDEVAKWCDYPISHADQIARHQYLVDKQDNLREKILSHPEYCDAQMAGYWIWGMSCWIGDGWCQKLSDGKVSNKMPVTYNMRGIHSERVKKISDIYDYMRILSKRMKNLRILCGDWKQGFRTPAILEDDCGIFFDPPYSLEAGRDNNLYRHENLSVSHEVREWCIQHEGKCKIVLAGYDVEHCELERRGWQSYEWKTQGGYSNQRKNGDKNTNNERERLWFSPLCNRVGITLFNR